VATESDFPSTGLVGGLQFVYEGLLLRDILGYAFPGATLITGVMLLIYDPARNPWQGATIPKLIVLILASYVCGVFLRVLGNLARVLVNSAEHVGWFGDPWELSADPAKERYPLNQVWRGEHDARILDIYRDQLRGDADGKKLSSLTRRESLFLHIAGNFGMAFLLLFLLVLVFWLFTDLCPGPVSVTKLSPGIMYQSLSALSGKPIDPCARWKAIPYVGTLRPLVVLLGLLILSSVLIVGHYIHARAFKLLLRAAKP
jgi:hypothetical protein